MTELKTKKTRASVKDFIATIRDEKQRGDTTKLVQLIEKTSGDKGEMWGSAIIGFGHRILKYPSGRELDWMRIGFSPRKGSLTLYMGNYKKYEELLKSLGKHKISGSCLHIKRLDDIDEASLKKLITNYLREIS